MKPAEREAALRAYLESAGPVVWGESDCCAFPAKWIEKATGQRVVLPRYGSREEALALIAAAGGLVPLAEQVLAPLHLQRTYDPQFGDVGAIRLTDFDVGVIFAQGGIAAWRAWDGAQAGGVGFIKPRTILIAWTVA